MRKKRMRLPSMSTSPSSAPAASAEQRVSGGHIDSDEDRVAPGGSAGSASCSLRASMRTASARWSAHAHGTWCGARGGAETFRLADVFRSVRAPAMRLYVHHEAAPEFTLVVNANDPHATIGQLKKVHHIERNSLDPSLPRLPLRPSCHLPHPFTPSTDLHRCVQPEARPRARPHQDKHR